MAKKNLAVLIIAALTASGVFAQGIGLSAGIGGYFGSDFGGGVEVGGSKTETPYFGGGGFAFFDAKYAELSFGVLGGALTAKTENEDLSYSLVNLDIALLGKFPIAVGNSLTVFPLLGIDYQVTVSLKDEDGNEYEGFGGVDGVPGDFSALWFKFGGGLDYAITSKLYLRFEALYGVRIPNKVETDVKDKFDAYDADILLGHGLTAKLAVGYKF
jgi:hypothetical protein